MVATEEDEYEVPLRDQRYFGAGIKRKRIKFVQSSSTEAITSSPTTPSESAADRYLSIVFKKPVEVDRATSAPPLEHEIEEDASKEDHQLDASGDKKRSDTVLLETACEICGRQVKSSDPAVSHESSIAHQICLKHSYPPSHLDRKRQGLAVLESQGWDPDSRKGLGVDGEGILHPIKAKDNPEKAGIGMSLKDLKMKQVERPAKLDAGKVRAMENDGKKKAAKLRDAFYRSDDMEKYLGAEGETNSSLDMDAFRRAKRK